MFLNNTRIHCSNVRLIELAAEKSADVLSATGSNNIKRTKSWRDWKQSFIDAGKSFIDSEKYDVQMIDVLSEILSEKNMSELSSIIVL